MSTIDVQAVTAKYAGYPNIIRFIEIQAESGNIQLIRKLLARTPEEVASFMHQSLPALEELAAAAIRGMQRVERGENPKD